MDLFSIHKKIKENNTDSASTIQKKLLALNYNQSLIESHNDSTCYILENRLKSYVNSLEANPQHETEVEEILAKNNIKPPILESNLKNVDLKSMFQKYSSCSNSNKFTEKEFENFKEIFQGKKPDFPEIKQKRIASSFVPQTCNKNAPPLKVLSEGTSTADQAKDVKYNRWPPSKTNETDEVQPKKPQYFNRYGRNRSQENDDEDSSKPNRYYNRYSKPNKQQDEGDGESCSSASNPNPFKTAREELTIQNRKFNRPGLSNNMGGQKRKLGIRRNVTHQFVSPLMSNNSNEDIDMSPSSSVSDTDERLKNIDPKMVELIKSEIMDVGTNVEWNDIAGLEFAKTAIQEAVVYPMLRPDIFTGLRRPPKGILLFGPPGTGKTLIGKCVASQSKSTFFSISASSLTSKWIGEGEKMVRALFTVARCYQPAIIFIDEIDSLLCQRSESEHESSRRIKTEFLVQLDGATTDNDERILLIGATNRPQELDEAARRRFVKRLYIPLPEYEARLQLVSRLLSGERHCLNQNDFEEIARLSDGYSGADIKNLCSEASLGPIRSIDIRVIEKIQAAEVRPLAMEDFQKAFNRVKSSVAPSDLNQYLIWDKTYGSGL